jgi:hypothetical protein
MAARIPRLYYNQAAGIGGVADSGQSLFGSPGCAVAAENLEHARSKSLLAVGDLARAETLLPPKADMDDTRCVLPTFLRLGCQVVSFETQELRSGWSGGWRAYTVNFNIRSAF